MTEKLQLLIIDLGDSCVIKVESLEKEFWLHLNGLLEDSTGYQGYQFTSEGQSQLIPYPFSVVRAAIDRLGGANDKPLPRIEGYTYNSCRVYSPEFADGFELSCAQMAAIETIIGHSLPIWEPHRGEWEKFSVSTAGLVDIWRFTLGVKNEQNS